MAFEQLQAVINDGITKRQHTCVQICVSVNDRTQLNAGFGKATDQIPASAETVMLWRSAGKPLTVAGILCLAEQGELAIGDLLGRHLPAVQGTQFEQITLTQLMSHDTGLPALETGWPESDWYKTLDGILKTPQQRDPKINAYQPQATWFLLGEVLRHKTQAHTFAEALETLVLDPLSMNRTSCGFSEHAGDARYKLLPDLFFRKGTDLFRSDLSDGRALQSASPGGNMRGPVSDLVLFYEMLLRRGVLADGQSFLKETSVELMTQRHRVGRFDQTLQHKVDMGLGCVLDSKHHGPMVPYGFGQFSSKLTFGHGGAQCSMGFADPAHGLAVAWSSNGFCSEPQHQRRNRAINEAIYKDLGLHSSHQQRKHGFRRNPRTQ